MKTKKPTDSTSISADLRAKTPTNQSPERDERGKKDRVAEGLTTPVIHDALVV